MKQISKMVSNFIIKKIKLLFNQSRMMKSDSPLGKFKAPMTFKMSIISNNMNLYKSSNMSQLRFRTKMSSNSFRKIMDQITKAVKKSPQNRKPCLSIFIMMKITSHLDKKEKRQVKMKKSE